MITPDYIKGYIAALRTMETAYSDAITKLRSPTDDETQYTYLEKTLDISGLETAIKFIQNQRQEYKQLVDKLNKENSGG